MNSTKQNLKVLTGMLNATSRDLEYDIDKDARERKVKEIDALGEAVAKLSESVKGVKFVNAEAKKIKTILTPGKDAYMVFWQRMANSGSFVVYANSAQDAIAYIGYSKEFCQMTAVKIAGEVLVEGKIG